MNLNTTKRLDPIVYLSCSSDHESICLAAIYDDVDRPCVDIVLTNKESRIYIKPIKDNNYVISGICPICKRLYKIAFEIDPERFNQVFNPSVFLFGYKDLSDTEVIISATNEKEAYLILAQTHYLPDSLELKQQVSFVGPAKIIFQRNIDEGL